MLNEITWFNYLEESYYNYVDNLYYNEKPEKPLKPLPDPVPVPVPGNNS